MAGRQEAPRFSKLSLRPGLPLQATLASLVEEGARTLFPQGANAQTLNGLQADVTALWDPAMHGTVEDPDLQGFDSATRALMVMEGSKMAWAYDPQQSAETLLKTASRAAQVRVPANAIVLSLAAASLVVCAPWIAWQSQIRVPRSARALGRPR